MKRIKYILLLVSLFLFQHGVWGQLSASYSVSSISSVVESGTIPLGSTSTYSQTYSTAKQITSGDSATLTLTGYDGLKIIGITLRMRSNASKGAGSLNLNSGSNTIYTIPSSKFNTTNWNGAWSTSYVDITRNITSYIVQAGENVTIIINASENSLYIEKYTIIYELPATPPSLSNESYTGTVGTVFSEIPNNTGGAVGSWDIVSGSLPTGLSFNTATGEIYGTPTADGSFSVNIKATNSNGSSTATYTFVIDPASTVTSCFGEDFSSVTNGNNTSTGGSGSAWSGNTNFPTVDKAYQAGGAVKLGTGSAIGSIESMVLSSISGDIDVKIKVKGWSTVEGDIKVSIDGQSQTLPYTAKMADPFEEITAHFTGVSAGSTLKIETKAKRAFIDEVEIICHPFVPCTPTVSIVEIRPSSAPANANVQVKVNDATLISSVELDSANLPFTVVDATTIEFQIPSGTTGGTKTLTLYDNTACSPNTTFEIQEVFGVCSDLPSTYNDLFISEIYDSQGLNEWYMELFNPTPNPITLDGVYSIERRGDVGGSVDRSIPLTGTVPAHSTYTLFLGDNPAYSGSYTCTGIAFDFIEEGTGINEDDEIDLVKNGVKVDEAHAPDNKGYSLLREIVSGETVPTTSYSATQWNINSTESCADLGIFNTTFTTIDMTSPADITGCSVDLIVNSTTPGITYQWYYNDASSMTTWKKVNATNLSGVTITGETTNHLLISGNTASLDGYQFYCEAFDGSCGKMSESALFHHGVSPIYRSVNNGNWTTISNWEVANSITGPWSAACDYPTAINSEKVFIENGTHIILDIDNDIDFIEIKNGGTLETEPNSQLKVYNSVTGTDFIVDGTYIYRGNSSNSLILDGGATWTLGNNATIIKTNTGAAVVLRDQYEGGISTIPATAQWIQRYNGDGDQTLVTVNMYYPNLRFENTTGTAYTTNSNASFSGNSTNTIIKGNLEVGMTGTSTYKLYHNNFNVNPILILGNFSIGAGSSVINERGSAVSQLGDGTGFEVKGNILINGTLDLTSNAATPLAERVLKLSGVSNQTVSGSGIIHVYKIEIDKPSGDVLLNRDLQAQNELKMVNGNIYTNSSLLELGLNTTQKGILNYTNGYVIGKMKRWFNGTNTGDASSLFPMGWDNDPVIGMGMYNRFARIEFTSAPSSGGSLTTEFIPQDMIYNGLWISAANSGGFGSRIENAEDQGYWTLTANTISGGTYNASFTGQGFTEIVDLSDITLLKRSNSSSPWIAPGAHVMATGTLAIPTVHRTGLTGFSDFGFGSRNIDHPLPIELIRFDVTCIEGNTLLTWSTASESNNDRFEIEQSTDLINWKLIAEVRGAGNSNELREYEYTYRNDQHNFVYYRLTQVDFDGEMVVYAPISSSCFSEEKGILAYPIPAKDELTIVLNQINLNEAILSIINLDGKVIEKQMLSPIDNILHLSVSNYSEGVYFIQVQTEEGEMWVEKISVSQ